MSDIKKRTNADAALDRIFGSLERAQMMISRGQDTAAQMELRALSLQAANLAYSMEQVGTLRELMLAQCNNNPHLASPILGEGYAVGHDGIRAADPRFNELGGDAA